MRAPLARLSTWRAGSQAPIRQGEYHRRPSSNVARVPKQQQPLVPCSRLRSTAVAGNMLVLEVGKAHGRRWPHRRAVAVVRSSVLGWRALRPWLWCGRGHSRLSSTAGIQVVAAVAAIRLEFKTPWILAVPGKGVGCTVVGIEGSSGNPGTTSLSS